MCDHCHASLPPGETRREFIRKLAVATAAVGVMGTARVAAAQAAAPATLPTAGWARLITPHREWDFHRDRESHEVEFLRQDPTLNFNTRSATVHPDDLADLCRSPFIFTFDMTMISSGRAWENIREYLYRGGFLYVDNCVHVSPDIRAYREDHLRRLTRLLPASEWRRLSDDHPIYRARYPIKVKALPDDQNTPPDQLRALYGVFDDDRMVALVSMAHLFCGWPEHPEYVDACMKQMANIYAYSRSH